MQRLDNAYQAFFRRVKKGDEAPGFPKFKKRGQWDSITYPQYTHRPSQCITVPKVGTLPMVFHRDLPEEAKVKTLTITQDGGKWFACFSFEMPFEVEPKQDLQPSVGIDLGLIDFYYPSDGPPVKAPKFYRRLQERLRILQRRIAKAEKRSRRWYKLLRAIQKVHYRIRCQRLDFLHKEANRLLSRVNLIVHENLRIRNMVRRPQPKQDENEAYIPNGACAKSGLNKSIHDAGWGGFLAILRYKAARLGKTIIAVPPQYTSQECSECHRLVKKSLSTRTHRCKCGYIGPRDHNAANIVLGLGLQSLGITP